MTFSSGLDCLNIIKEAVLLQSIFSGKVLDVTGSQQEAG
jgi:hypothetical protein